MVAQDVAVSVHAIKYSDMMRKWLIDRECSIIETAIEDVLSDEAGFCCWMQPYGFCRVKLWLGIGCFVTAVGLFPKPWLRISSAPTKSESLLP